MAQPHISLAAEAITHVGDFPITNALLTTWLVTGFLIILAVVAGSNLKKHPGRFQVFVELVIGGLFQFFNNLGGAAGKRFTPLIVTFFLFILFSNWAGLLPGVGSIGFYEAGEHAQKIISKVFATPEETPVSATNAGETDIVSDPTHETTTVEEHAETTPEEHAETTPNKKFVPFFRGPTADLNTTIALGLIAFGLIQYAGIRAAGLSYFKKFLDFRSPIYFFIGILEIISDISKIISFAFRLFGNVFAGEVLLAVMASFLPVLLPIPFLGLEVFVGLIQALVFSMLTTVFINLAVAHGDHGHSEAHSH